MIAQLFRFYLLNLFLVLIGTGQLSAEPVKHHDPKWPAGFIVAIEQQNSMTVNLDVTIPVPPGAVLYSDYIQFTVGNPGVVLSPWQNNVLPVSQYFQRFGKYKSVFDKTVTINF